MEQNTIELSGVTFPIKLDNIVLQHIQETYGNMMDFELALIGARKEKNSEGKVTFIKCEPSIKVQNDVLPLMIKEGMAIKGENCELSNEDIIRMIDKNLYVIADIIHKEFKRAVEVKEQKKEKTSLVEKIMKMKEKKKQSIFHGFMLWVQQGWDSLVKR